MKPAPIKSLHGCSIALEIEDVLLDQEVFTAHDAEGTRFLVAHTAGRTWLCAPASDRALACVASGQAEVRDAFTHSSTGLVERLSVKGSSVYEESLRLCRDLTDEDLPRAGLRMVSLLAAAP